MNGENDDNEAVNLCSSEDERPRRRPRNQAVNRPVEDHDVVFDDPVAVFSSSATSLFEHNLSKSLPLSLSGEAWMPQHAAPLVRSRSKFHCEIAGIEVHFPLEKPFPTQIAIIEKMIESFKQKKHAIIESPTGTGKSLALLCGAVAFQCDSYRRHQDDPDVAIPRIVVASRTHSQLSAMATELKKLPYSTWATTLGSRRVLCLNSEVKNQINCDHACMQACADRDNKLSKKKMPPPCSKFRSLDDTTSARFAAPWVTGSDNSIFDVEDLRTMGDCYDICPFYATKSMAKFAHVVFVPYNYLFNNGRAYKGSIVIIDEAHNIPSQSNEKFTSEISDTELREVVTLCDKYRENVMLPSLFEFETPDISCVRSFASGFRAAIIRITKETIISEKEAAKKEYLLWSTHDSQAEFCDGFITERRCMDVSTALYAILKSDLMKELHALKIFQKLSNMINCLKSVLSSSFGFFAMLLRKPERSELMVSVVKVACLESAIPLQKMTQHAYSCVFSSGTLEPVKHFMSLLGQNTEMRCTAPLQGSHVINVDSQLLIGHVGTADDGVPIIGSHKAISGTQKFAEYATRIGNVLCAACNHAPGGALVFFSCFSTLQKVHQAWSLSGILHQLQLIKNRVLVEESGCDFRKLKSDFETEIAESGESILLCVYRGRLSEGVSFNDQLCRLCVCVGVPFPSFEDPLIKAKMTYLDRRHRPGLSGHDWYYLEAFQALNQALGRTIRHSRDYGCILLVDHRYHEAGMQKYLPRWLKSSVKPFSGIAELSPQMTHFFDAAKAEFGIGNVLRPVNANEHDSDQEHEEYVLDVAVRMMNEVGPKPAPARRRP
uniref:Helicase ATP-binding domain-containing protein n=1 Tax=Spongospora subterranea TaxID=70186 RepID=A0A0H5RA64_9EUKA|eukprot:CRZ10978.1 hypothetical protein [Spongospora subterranea]